MIFEAAAEAWRAGTAEADLRRLWEEYAAALRADRDAVPPGGPERFVAEVLDPFRLPVSARRCGPAIRAVEAWSRWGPDLVLPPGEFAAEKYAYLRDQLAALLERIRGHAEAGGGWFSRRSVPNPLSDPNTQRLLDLCRSEFDRLSHRDPTREDPGGNRLRMLAAEVDALLDAAPETWPPRAGRQLGRLCRLLLGEPSAVALLRGPAVSRLHAALSDPSTAAEAAAGFADQLTAEADRADWMDQVMATFRGWGLGYGIELLPRRWSFAQPPVLDEIRGDRVELAPVYRPDAPRRSVVRLKTVGLIRDGTVLRPAVVVVSAGPAPVGLAELEETVRDSPEPAAEAVRTALREWRAASLDGRLEAAAVGLFVEYWDRLRDPLPAEVGDRLAVVLAEEFGLTPFHPTHFRDHPDGWVQVAGGRMAAGRVREVVRPGLVTRAGELRVPARVMVE